MGLATFEAVGKIVKANLKKDKETGKPVLEVALTFGAKSSEDIAKFTKVWESVGYTEVTVRIQQPFEQLSLDKAISDVDPDEVAQTIQEHIQRAEAEANVA
jgi:NH3-dependent NAD+ synthetase